MQLLERLGVVETRVGDKDGIALYLSGKVVLVRDVLGLALRSQRHLLVRRLRVEFLPRDGQYRKAIVSLVLRGAHLLRLRLHEECLLEVL